MVFFTKNNPAKKPLTADRLLHCRLSNNKNHRLSWLCVLNNKTTPSARLGRYRRKLRAYKQIKNSLQREAVFPLEIFK
jgi:hypothetical protein